MSEGAAELSSFFEVSELEALQVHEPRIGDTTVFQRQAGQLGEAGHDLHALVGDGVASQLEASEILQFGEVL